MADNECNMESKIGTDGKIYYKCKKQKCDKECVFYLILDQEAKILEYGCECVNITFPNPGEGKEECLLEKDGPHEDGKKRKFYYRCKNTNCKGEKKECALWIKTKEVKGSHEFEDAGCDCIVW